VLSTNLDMVV